ncbi:MAG TPA: RIO1 family regulatory kinase/ATPase [Ilumatobacteraceae bacterium]|nr:RIO1 family regulatory kinase/ATPase [Ilumatobacteraceae bacterium]
MSDHPQWLVDEPYHDVDHGVIKSGKEAQVNLVERIADDVGDRDRSCFIARKRYLPRHVTQKGQLEALGVQRASAFRHDVQYREGRQFRKSRDRRAIERMSTYGKRLLQDRWTGTEHEVMLRLWHQGVSVPYPIGYGDDVFDLEYVGSWEMAAPQLSSARLARNELDDAFEQLMVGLRGITAAGIAHGDLSAYNLLWWEGRLWFIDFPQSIDIAANLQGLDFLHRDVLNICGWFQHRGLAIDAEETFADLLSFL